MYMRAIFIAVEVGSMKSALGISSSTALKSLIIQRSWNCAVAICLFMSGTHRTNFLSGSVRLSASITNSLWSRAISFCASLTEPGGRICPRAVFAWRRFWPSTSAACTDSMAALTFL